MNVTDIEYISYLLSGTWEYPHAGEFIIDHQVKNSVKQSILIPITFYVIEILEKGPIRGVYMLGISSQKMIGTFNQQLPIMRAWCPINGKLHSS